MVFDPVLILTRVAAKFVDLAVCFFVTVFLSQWFGPAPGALLGVLYALLSDAVPVGRRRGVSIGKRLVRLRVVREVDGQPIGIRESMLRNSPFGVMMFFSIVPLVGWVILFLVGVPLVVLELTLMARSPKRQRLGDLMAETIVVHL